MCFVQIIFVNVSQTPLRFTKSLSIILESRHLFTVQPTNQVVNMFPGDSKKPPQSLQQLQPSTSCYWRATRSCTENKQQDSFKTCQDMTNCTSLFCYFTSFISSVSRTALMSFLFLPWSAVNLLSAALRFALIFKCLAIDSKEALHHWEIHNRSVFASFYSCLQIENDSKWLFFIASKQYFTLLRWTSNQNILHCNSIAMAVNHALFCHSHQT